MVGRKGRLVCRRRRKGTIGARYDGGKESGGEGIWAGSVGKEVQYNEPICTKH